MTKGLKLSVAASAFLAVNAFAGTAGYIQVVKANIADRADASGYTIITEAAAQALVSTPVTVAHEEMKAGTLNLGTDNIAGTNEVTIKYVPTTNIPGGTLIEFTLANATFNVGTTVYLLKDADDAGAGTVFTNIASSDGLTTGVNKITMLTQSGVEIVAGTELVLSVDTVTDVAPQIQYAVEGCSTGDVTITANRATTDGGTGYDILGAVSAAKTLIDGQQQYAVTMTPVSAVVSEVDVEDPALRKLFVSEINNGALDETQTDETIYSMAFSNIGSTLDIKHTLGVTDLVSLNFTPSATLSSNMAVFVNDTVVEGGAAADTFSNVITTTVPGATIIGNNTYLASVLFPDDNNDGLLLENNDEAATTNTVYVNIQNTDLDAIMSYNYTMSTDYKLNLDSAVAEASSAYNDDLTCTPAVTTHNVGINGAILKAPYLFQDQNNNDYNSFVRITNEDDVEAEIFADVFDEAAGSTGTAGNVIRNVSLGKVGATSSRTITANELLTASGTATLTNLTAGDTAGRFSSTFVVTSPKEKVYGTSVLKMEGKERVMPLKDLSGFAQ